MKKQTNPKKSCCGKRLKIKELNKLKRKRLSKVKGGDK